MVLFAENPDKMRANVIFIGRKSGKSRVVLVKMCECPEIYPIKTSLIVKLSGILK